MNAEHIKVIRIDEAGYMGFVAKTIDPEQAKKVFRERHGYEPRQVMQIGWNLYVGPVMKVNS